ncbi:MAG: acyltransferase family protein [Anaerolineaceae bacterium]
MTTQISQVTRRYDLDWLRVITIITVFFFHTARFFDTGGWHLKNLVRYQGFQDFTDLLIVWIMPMMFVISGAAIYYGFQKGKAGKFLKDKVLRLLVPVVVGMFTHSILQIYFDALTNNRFEGSFIAFIPHYFEGIFPFGGNFSVTSVHLWYLEVLFIFCLLFLPIFIWWKGSGQKFCQAVGNFLAKPGALYLLALPTMILATILDPSNIGMKETGGWSVIVYIFFFLPGYIFIPNEAVQTRLMKQRWISIVLALFFSFAWLSQDDHAFGSTGYMIDSILISLAAWSCIFALLGIVRRYLTFTNPFLSYANEAVLPFYILHQPVILSVGFFVAGWAIPAIGKYLIMLICAFIVIMVIYEFLVRRFNVMRFLFGMKPKSKSTVQ